MAQEDELSLLVQFTLTDLGGDGNVLQNLLKLKMRKPTFKTFSGKFSLQKSIKLPDTAYNFVIVKEYNLLLLAFENGQLSLLSLDTFNTVHSLKTMYKFHTVCLERCSESTLNVVFGTADKRIAKFNLKKIIEEKLSDTTFETAKIWVKGYDFELLWGLQAHSNKIYAIDHSSTNPPLTIIDSHTGDLISQLDLRREYSKLVDLKFISNDTMVICGVGFVGIFKQDISGGGWDWTCIKEVRDTIEQPMELCFSVFYEEKSERIVVSDAIGEILIFDCDLNRVPSNENLYGLLKRNYCVAINEKNGQLLVCSTSSPELLVFY